MNQTVTKQHRGIQGFKCCSTCNLFKRTNATNLDDSMNEEEAQMAI